VTGYPNDSAASLETLPASWNWKENTVFVRWLLLAAVFSVELLLIPAVLGREGLVRQLGTVGPTILRAVLGFAALFTTFAWLKFRPALTSTSVELSEFKVDWRFLSAHISLIILFAFLSSSLGRSVSSSQYSQSSNGFLFAWFAAGICSIGFGAISAIPLAFWRRILRDTGYLCIGSFTAASLGAMVGMAGQSLWPVATAATFWLSKAALKPLIPDLIVDPANLVVGTARFAIEVAPECSGLESVGLVISFAVAWLVIFRKECRVYRALLLIPIGVGVTFLLNALRIAALVLIGNAGHEQVAMRGFHSQAGWIILNFVALGFAVSPHVSQ
jgi:exosortase/archaeosortase family protein